MAGQSATFSVAATGEAPLSYQWTFNGANVGSSSSSYTRSNCQLADNGARVRVTVSDARGSVPSDTATLTVNPIGTYYYASPSGNSSNSGRSTNSPWPLQYALVNAGVSNTVIAMDGVYSSAGGFDIVSGYCRNLRAQNKWRAVLTGSTAYSQLNLYQVNYCVVDGICITNASNNGISISGDGGVGCHYTTIKNCWIKDNGWHGIAAGSAGNSDNIVENCLIELSKHGDYPASTNRGYALYIMGPNNIVRNNVFRNNSGAGLHYYTGSNGAYQNNTWIYNNLTYGHTKTGAYGGLLVTGENGGTNYIYGNTILDGVMVHDGTVCITNNIILPNPNYPTTPIYRDTPTPTVLAGYNLGTVAFNVGGVNNLVTNWAALGFVNTNQGLYWLSSASAARNRAKSDRCGPVDFFSSAQASVFDIGAFQYSATLAGDTRVLDPSPVNPDYWSRP
jgi:hypothetical protein